MRIKKIKVSNYRTLEEIELEFTNFYTAICGKNDSGKSNLINVVMNIFKSDFIPFIGFETDFSLKQDYTKWKEKDKIDKFIRVVLDIEINKIIDNELYDFILTYLNLKSQSNPDEINLNLFYNLSEKEPKEDVKIELLTQKFDGIKAKEILKKIQSARAIVYHNSTYQALPFPFERFDFDFSDEIGNEATTIEKSFNQQLSKKIKFIAKNKQKAITDLLGRLTDKYKVELTIPKMINRFPIEIALGKGDLSIPLKDWGSGTQNRTKILMNLLQAKKLSETDEDISKITPLFIIEEPESFLHPSAQAEFGKLLQDLSNEFGIQVIATTHSPYLLSQSEPSANILLCRDNKKGKLNQTYKIETSGDNWMQPYSNILGINSEEMNSWKGLFFTKSDFILVVEGKIDCEYFTELQDEKHGKNKLLSEIEIISLDGVDNFNNQLILKFIKIKNRKVFFLFDMDAKKKVQKTIDSLSFVKNKDFTYVGIEKKREDIEDLIPHSIISNILAKNPELAMLAMKDINAKNQLKIMIKNEFLTNAKIENNDFDEFYKIVKIINKALI